MDAPASFRGLFRTDREARAVYSETAGIQRILPMAIAVPTGVEDLVTLIEWAKREGAALIPRGSGSSMAGAAIGPGVIVDLSRWKNVGEIQDGSITVQPGAICAEVQRVARLKGLRFPVSPSSAPFCTIGGMTATNAAGAHTLRYGSMRQWVTAIEWVGTSCRPERTCHPERSEGSALPDEKQALRFTRDDTVRKNSSGYFTDGDELDLLIGSEGTLGFFTSIELRLTEAPKSTASVMGVFSSLEAATAAAIRARESGAAACELLDKTFLEFAKLESAEAILIADAEGQDDGEASAIAARIVAGFKSAGAADARLAETAAERERLWELRHAASPMLTQMGEHIKSMQVVEDGCVPPPRLGEYVAGLRQAYERNRIRGVLFGHAGDAHVHANALVDMRERDWRPRVDGLLEEVTSLVASLGGTLSGEHGDGRLRTPLLFKTTPAERLAEFAAIKKRYDPDGILNPGVKVNVAGQVSGTGDQIGDIKHDPALAPHPEAVIRAFKHVERERAYSEFRLDLV
jgi:FAD/FMN-containing dehydrogenase